MNNKIKFSIAISSILAVALLFTGILTMPKTDVADDVSDNSEIIDTQETVVPNSDDKTEESKDSLEPENESTQNQTQTETNLSQSNAVTFSSIPEYSGKPYVAINNNVPVFSQNELTTVGYEQYSELDSLGRTGMAVASLGKETIPKESEERGDISSIKPSGWVQGKYDSISGGWLYNRCHLIGWQLSAENANKKNLLTGTKYFNVNGMLPFENMVADYIKETGNHVAYRVTPIYEGNNLLAGGVQIEAYSVEDNGEGIQFNVFCYNVQPEIKIDYATGKNSKVSSGSSTSATAPSTDSKNESETVVAPTKPSTETPKEETNSSSSQTNGSTNINENTGTQKYVLNTNTKKFHYPDCRHVSKIADKNYAESSESRDSLIDQEYSPCGNCNP